MKLETSRRDRRDSRWDEHRRARREQLIDATIAAVGAHGAGVGMDEIAAAAGTSKTVVYRHFADRTELHVAVCARVAGHLTSRLRAAVTSTATTSTAVTSTATTSTAVTSTADPRQVLAVAVETYLAFVEADPELYRFVVQPSPADRPTGRGPGDPDPIANLSHLVGDEAAAIVAVALQEAGRDPSAALPWGHGLVGLVRSAGDWWLQADRPMPRVELAAHLTDLAWAGLSGVVTRSSSSSKEDDL